MNVISNAQGKGFDVVNSIRTLSSGGNPSIDRSQIRVFDAAGNELSTIQSGSFTGECGAADVIGAKRLILTELVTYTPAAGIVAASWALSVTAWDAATGASVWTAEVVPAQKDAILCDAYDGNLQNASATFDGRWGVVTWFSIGFVIELSTGKTYARDDLLGTLGNYVVTGTSLRVGNGHPNTATLIQPGTWQQLGKFETGRAGDISLESGDRGQVLASTGMFGDPNVGSRAGTGLATDGNALFTNQSGHLRGYTLPDVKQVWDVTSPQYHTDTLIAASASIVLVDRSSNGGGVTRTLLALDARSGAVVWTLPAGLVCAMTSTQLMLAINDQLATIDLVTGKQLSYTSNPFKAAATGTRQCPRMVGNGIGGVAWNASQVAQMLMP